MFRSILMVLCFFNSNMPISKAGVIVEVAPLRSLMGQWATRFEYSIGSNISIGGGVDRTISGSLKQSNHNLVEKFGLEVSYYADLLGVSTVFLGGGLTYRGCSLGSKRRRDYSTAIQYDDDNSYDTWAYREQSILLPIFVGYRYTLGKIFTGSIRFTFDKALYSANSVVSKDIKSYGFEPSAEALPQKSSHVSAFIGVDI